MTELELYQSIAGVINGYRNDEFGVYDANHVARWAAQFEPHEKVLVLEETNRILKRNFITQAHFNSFIDNVINSKSIFGSDKDAYWTNVSLLNIQQNGSSQAELNDLFCKKLSQHYFVPDIVGKLSSTYIYLDDFLFTGNRLRSDLRNWIVNSAPQQCHVQIVMMGWYGYGQWYTRNQLIKFAQQAGKQITFNFASHPNLRLENTLRRKDFSHVFWPPQSVEQIPGVREYIAREEFEPHYRTPNGIENQVFSRRHREAYEGIMLKYGLKILSFSATNSPVVKPLGYHNFSGFGFGSTVFSFRNCPNNNPLAFWWGDPTSHPSHPFSRWYPLLQRKTYRG